ncbi:hypothetical protein Prudu_008855 [Prunus dulcis]|uniref:Uncharacterized protein n=1 Tax=Prunus dulcis TaxID=3755 RepID=A0A4Y1R518_PRUDU|nr:hypothetical protein Prudu_008855 [Prunus dulcis]
MRQTNNKRNQKQMTKVLPSIPCLLYLVQNIGSKLFVTKKGLTGNYTQRSKSPPPPPKASPTPKQTPTITDILEKSPSSTRCISSA